MSIRLYFKPPAALSALALLAGSLWLAPASAQPALPASQAAPAAAADTAPLPYRSAFEGYQRYSDEKIVNWKQANDTAGQIGGWRAYAKEASQEPSPDGAAKPAPSNVPAKP